MPSKEETTGERGKSLTLTIGVGESTDEDGGVNAVHPRPKPSEQIVMGGVAAQGATMDTGMQVDEDSLSMPQTNEIETVCSVLLCIAGFLNGIYVTFLIDSGASECFLSTSFVEKNKIKTRKTKEKLKIQLADRTVRVSNLIVEQACAGFDEHAEFVDFSVINLPKYETILGKPWLDRWNPVIDWQKNTMVCKMGKRTITVSGL